VEVKRRLEEPSETETRISFVDSNGHLCYRGIDIHDLARYSTYEETVYLLLYGKLPTKSQLLELSNKLATRRRLPAGVVVLIGSVPHSAPPMDVLRTAISAMAMFDPNAKDNRIGTLLERGIGQIAQATTIVTTHNHIRNSRLPIEPDPEMGHAENFLYMLKGRRPEPWEIKTLDQCLVLHADHGLNASTFAARVTASAQADMYAALTSAVGTLKGTIHGGANQKVMEMLLDIKDERMVEQYIAEALRQGRKIPGFGHRIYKVEDPRVVHLRRLSKEACERTGNGYWFDLSRKVEDAVRSQKGLFPNMDFYSATIYYALGFPVDMFTTVFACSRMAGWVAHIIEQFELNILIRPMGDYVGLVNQPYIPIENR
jgi:citrate synthase